MRTGINDKKSITIGIEGGSYVGKTHLAYVLHTVLAKAFINTPLLFEGEQQSFDQIKAKLDAMTKEDRDAHLIEALSKCTGIKIVDTGVKPTATIPEMGVAKEVQALIAALQRDPDYAWSWHCNLAMAFHDAVPEDQRPHNLHAITSEGSARFLTLFAGIDIREHDHYKDQEKQWKADAEAHAADVAAALGQADQDARKSAARIEELAEEIAQSVFEDADPKDVHTHVFEIDSIDKAQEALSVMLQPIDAYISSAFPGLYLNGVDRRSGKLQLHLSNQPNDGSAPVSLAPAQADLIQSSAFKPATMDDLGAGLTVYRSRNGEYFRPIVIKEVGCELKNNNTPKAQRWVVINNQFLYKVESEVVQGLWVPNPQASVIAKEGFGTVQELELVYDLNKSMRDNGVPFTCLAYYGDDRSEQKPYAVTYYVCIGRDPTPVEIEKLSKAVGNWMVQHFEGKSMAEVLALGFEVRLGTESSWERKSSIFKKEDKVQPLSGYRAARVSDLVSDDGTAFYHLGNFYTDPTVNINDNASSFVEASVPRHWFRAVSENPNLPPAGVRLTDINGTIRDFTITDGVINGLWMVDGEAVDPQ